MKWQDSDKSVCFFEQSTVYYNNVNGNRYDPFSFRSWCYSMYSNGYIYPKKDLTAVSKLEVKTVKPESTLYFDPGSGFPRFKLSLTDNKRCIKIAKADYIVVSGSTDYQSPETTYVVLEDDKTIYFVNQDDWQMWYSSKLEDFVKVCSQYHTFNDNLHVIYQGRVNSYTKDSVYLAKYAKGEYTKPFITDVELDKVVCDMCPEPTLEEFLSILDMLDSQDASVVQLGVKMIAGYNVDKYKMSMRLLLQTRQNWFTYTRQTVATKQLMETLNINNYQITDNFPRGAVSVQHKGETYTVEDIAIAKQLSAKLIKQWLQNEYQRQLLSYDFEWLPDERKIELT